MEHNKNKKPRNKVAPTIDQKFTGAKTPEYAVFYNIAYWWISDLLKTLYEGEKIKKEETVTEDYSKYINRFISEGEKTGPSTLPDKAYLRLRDYLWKGYLFDKNSSGQELTEKDKRLIHKMIAKLAEVRNFHSHYWHDNVNLIFDKELSEWIDDLHIYALEILQKEKSFEVDKYIENFKFKPKKRELSFFDKHDNNYYITQDGRNFFLSFFLKNSEITRFMQHRKGCKRNDKPEFKIKHLAHRFYTHRDGATQNRYSIENNAFSELDAGSQTEILKARQVYKMVSYLNDVPSEVIDKKLFPLYYNNQQVTNATQLIGFINETQMLTKCTFSELKNKESEPIKHELVFAYTENKYRYKIRVTALHKIVLDIIRDPKREDIFYETLKTFSDFRDAFPKKLDEFAKGDGFVEEMNEYYTFKLKAHDKTRGKLGALIDKFSQNTSLDHKSFVELKELAVTDPIELVYYNFYFKDGQKPRPANLFMEFAANYLIHKNVCSNWQWLVEKFEPEPVAKRVENQTEIKNVVKRIKNYSEIIPEGYRLSLKDNHALVRLKSNPKFVIGIGEHAMRNLLMAHFENKPIDTVLKRTAADLDKIKQAGESGTELKFGKGKADIHLLNEKTLPQYLQLMMRSPQAIENETMMHAVTKAKTRIKNLLDYFKQLQTGETKLNPKEINTQLIRCYKYFDWNYPNSSEYKFLRQNEYQLMSIYHYTLAKPDNSSHYLSLLRQKLFVDINKHMPANLKQILSEVSTLDELFQKVLKETMARFTKWNNKLNSMGLPQKKECLNKLGIHVPIVPVPDAANNTNCKQMEHIPFMLHPALVFMAFNYPRESNIFTKFRNNEANSKGLVKELYNYESYKVLNEKMGIDQPKQTHKIIGTLNNLKTLDTLIWLMAKDYLNETTSAILKNLAQLLTNEGNFQINKLFKYKLPVYTSENTNPKFKVMVMFKQLGDFMLITGKPLEKLAMQVLNRYPTHEGRMKVEIKLVDDFYQIPYIHIKQEMDRVYHDSLIVTDMVLDWEKEIVDKVNADEKQALIDAAHSNPDNSRAHINFYQVCNYATLKAPEHKELRHLRNHALHAVIPGSDWNYKQKLNDDRIKKLLNITDEKLKKYEKKNAYYEALALLNKE